MSKISPLGNRVLVRLQKFEAKTESGIILPEIGDETQTNGEVVAIGNLVEDVKVEDRVIYSQSILEVGDEEEKLVIVEEDNILAIIEEEK